MPELTDSVAWWIVAAALTGLIMIAFVLERPILQLKQPPPGTVALMVVVLALLAILAFGAYLLIF